MQIDGDCLGEVPLDNLRNGVSLRPPPVSVGVGHFRVNKLLLLCLVFSECRVCLAADFRWCVWCRHGDPVMGPPPEDRACHHRGRKFGRRLWGQASISISSSSTSTQGSRWLWRSGRRLRTHAGRCRLASVGNQASSQWLWQPGWLREAGGKRGFRGQAGWWWLRCPKRRGSQRLRRCQLPVASELSVALVAARLAPRNRLLLVWPCRR